MRGVYLFIISYNYTVSWLPSSSNTFKHDLFWRHAENSRGDRLMTIRHLFNAIYSSLVRSLYFYKLSTFSYSVFVDVLCRYRCLEVFFLFLEGLNDFFFFYIKRIPLIVNSVYELNFHREGGDWTPKTCHYKHAPGRS